MLEVCGKNAPRIVLRETQNISMGKSMKAIQHLHQNNRLPSLCLSLLCLACSPLLAAETVAQKNTVSICADPDPAPWIYWKKDAHGQPTKQAVGASLDIVRAAFTKLNVQVEFSDYPWTRCVALVEAGKIDFAMDAYIDEERKKRLDFSAHYYLMTPQIYTRTADNLVIKHISELKALKGCGILGASYGYIDMKPEDLDLGIGYESLFRKLKAKRCDYFVEELEVMTAMKNSGDLPFEDKEITRSAAQGAKSPSRHLMTLKNSAAAKLLPQFNSELSKLMQSGEAARIWKSHSSTIPYRS
jgi:polar amino acid transport system substrate-binding protein